MSDHDINVAQKKPAKMLPTNKSHRLRGDFGTLNAQRSNWLLDCAQQTGQA